MQTGQMPTAMTYGEASTIFAQFPLVELVSTLPGDEMLALPPIAMAESDADDERGKEAAPQTLRALRTQYLRERKVALQKANPSWTKSDIAQEANTRWMTSAARAHFTAHAAEDSGTAPSPAAAEREGSDIALSPAAAPKDSDIAPSPSKIMLALHTQYMRTCKTTLRDAYPAWSTAQIVEEARGRWMSSAERANGIAESGYSASELKRRRFV